MTVNRPPPLAVTVPRDEPPSPQLMVAVKSPAAALRLASLKVATTPENDAPSVALTEAPCPFRAASPTVADPVVEIDAPPASAICTETV